MNDLCVLFAYHLDDRVTRHNFDVLRRNNPEVDIYPVLFGDIQPYLPHSVVYGGTFPLPPAPSTRWYWANPDLLLYDFISRAPQRYERYVFLEWDALCNLSVRDLYQPVWNRDLVVSDPIAFATARHSWYHFRKLPYEKLLYFSADHLAAAAPLCGALVSARCLHAIVEQVQLYWSGFSDLFSEIRIATAARLANYAATRCERIFAPTFITDPIPFEPRMLTEPGIYHPIKALPDDVS